MTLPVLSALPLHRTHVLTHSSTVLIIIINALPPFYGPFCLGPWRAHSSPGRPVDRSAAAVQDAERGRRQEVVREGESEPIRSKEKPARSPGAGVSEREGRGIQQGR